MDVGAAAALDAAAPTRWSARANAGKDFRTKLAHDTAWSETPASKYRSQMSRATDPIAAPAAAAAVISNPSAGGLMHSWARWRRWLISRNTLGAAANRAPGPQRHRRRRRRQTPLPQF